MAAVVAYQTCYACTSCARRVDRWVFRCPSCRALNRLVEVPPLEAPAEQPAARKRPTSFYERFPHGFPARRQVGDPPTTVGRPDIPGPDRHDGLESSAPASTPDGDAAAEAEEAEERAREAGPRVVRVADVEAKSVLRTPTGLAAFDRVLGGGLQDAFALMLAGPPGAGKSTLGTQTASHFGEDAAYALIEESEDAEAETARRVARANFHLVTHENRSVHGLIDGLEQSGARYWVFDSLMAAIDPALDSQPGTPSQVCRVAELLYHRAHATGRYRGRDPRTIVIVAHGTKDGDMAGPYKALHWVDGACKFTHVDPLTWEEVGDQSKPTRAIALSVHVKMRKTGTGGVGRFWMRPQFLADGVTRNPVGGQLVSVDRRRDLREFHETLSWRGAQGADEDDDDAPA